jgi:BolA-like protein 1
METKSLSTSSAAADASEDEPAASNIGPLEQTIRDKLAAAFHPVVHLDVINESHMHNVPRHSETHFKVIVVSAAFDGVSVLQRHRKINEALADELQRKGGIHALSIVAKTPAQWEEMVQNNRTEVEPSPKCRGGDGSLPSKSRSSS